MDLPFLIGGIEYERMIHAGTGIDVVATGGVDAQILAQGLKIWLGCTVAGQIHREHPAPFATTEGRVIGVVIKNDQIARIRFQRNAAGKFLWWNTEKLF